MIELASSSSDSDSYNYDTVKLLNSDNNFVKLGQIVKINKVLRQFKDKELDNTDKNLIKGLFKRRPQRPYAEDLNQIEKLKNIDIETLGAVTKSTQKAFILPRELTMVADGPAKDTQK